MKMTRSNKNRTVLGAVRAVVIGAVCGAVLCAGLLAVFAFSFVKVGYIPQFAINPIIIAVSAFSAFVSGFFAAKVSKKNGLFFGAISGLLLFELFLLAGVIAFQGPPVLTTLTRFAVMVLAGAIGGLLSVSKKSKIK